MPRRDSAESVQRGKRHEGAQARGVVEEAARRRRGARSSHRLRRDPLHRARTNAELLGDLVQTRPVRCSQSGTDAPFQLGVDERATAMLARGLGPSNPVYLTGASASQSAIRVGASTSRVVVSTAR